MLRFTSKHLFNSLLFRLGAFVLVVESLVLAVIGVYYIERFSREIDNNITAQAQLPGMLMNRQLLRFDVIADKEIMTELLGEEFVDGMVVGANGRVFYAFQTAHVNRSAADIPGLDPTWFTPQTTSTLSRRFSQDGDEFLASVTPLIAFPGAEPYFFAYVKIRTTQSEARKRAIAFRFVAGSGLSVLATWLAILFFTRRLVTRPLSRLEECALQLASGNLELQIDTSRDDELGSLARSYARMRDSIRQKIRQLENSNQELEQKEERLRAFVNALPDIAFVIDERGCYLEVLSSQGNLMYAGAERIKGKFFHSVLPPALAESFLEIVHRTMETGEPQIMEYELGTRFGLRWFEGRLAPMRSPDGQPGQVVWLALDISTRKAAEEMRQASIEASAASKAKTEFLTTVSHEMRTPMNVLIGMADLLSETGLSEEQQQYVQIFKSASDALLNLIDDILDISKIEAGLLEIERTSFSLLELVENTCDVLAVRAHQKGLNLACRLDPTLPDRLLGDPLRLRQILINLLGNAVKFTERGYIVLDILPTPDPAPAGCVALHFSVSDTGIGIPEDKLSAIFDRFIQVDSSTTRQYGGTGLGLSICKRLVELMNGAITVRSELSRGSEFSFTLAVGLAAGETPAELPDARGLHVLIATDCDCLRRMLTERLTLWGAEVAQAENGATVPAHAARAEELGEPFSLVIVDNDLDGVDGIALGRRLHQTYGPDLQCLPLLRSDQLSKDIARVREAGLGLYLIKPVKLDRLASVILTLPTRAADLTSDTTPEAHQPRSGLAILVAEDSEYNVFVVQAYLRKIAARLDVARNGLEALELFRNGSYNIVLMDMQMPRMDGYTAAREIRNLEAEQGERKVPIVAMTAFALAGDAEKCLAAGCDMHLTKPLSRQALQEAISRLTRAQTPDEPVPPPSAESPASVDEPLVVHVDPDIIELVPGYIGMVRNHIQTIRRELETGEFSTIARLGHQMKGEGKVFGLDVVGELGKEIQAAAIEEHKGRVSDALDRLEVVLGRVRLA